MGAGLWQNMGAEWGPQVWKDMTNTVFPQSNAAATIFFTLQAPAATIRGQRLLEVNSLNTKVVS